MEPNAAPQHLPPIAHIRTFSLALLDTPNMQQVQKLTMSPYKAVQNLIVEQVPPNIHSSLT